MLSELPYVAFLAAILVLLPLPSHWRAKNVATLSLIAWLFIANVVYGTDAIIWRRSVAMVVPVWCDISTKIIIGAQMALPAACMCICIHLEKVASGRIVQISPSEKRRRQIVEGALCFGIPFLWMVLHYTMQGHRFDIIEYYGCRPNVYVSIPSILLIWVPPLILSAITLVYAALAYRHFHRHRITFSRHLEHSRSGLTASRYLRLMLMSVALMAVGVVSTSFTLYYTTLSIRPWTGWASVHSNFSRIGLYPLVLLPDEILMYYYVIWMLVPVSSFVFVIFFAFSRDTMLEYRTSFSWIFRCISRVCPRKPAPKMFAFAPSARIPISISISATRSDSAMCSTPTTSQKSHDVELTTPKIDLAYLQIPSPPPAYPYSSFVDRTSSCGVHSLPPTPIHHAFGDSSTEEKGYVPFPAFEAV